MQLFWRVRQEDGKFKPCRGYSIGKFKHSLGSFHEKLSFCLNMNSRAEEVAQRAKTLAPNPMTQVQCLESRWWREGTDSFQLSSDICTCAHTHIHTLIKCFINIL